MIPHKYAYITGCLLFFIPWAILYWHRKDLRNAMLIMGAIGAFGSLLTAQYWTLDWWRPQTITGTRVGIEDFILGISNAGIATVLYVELFHKRLYRRKKTDHSKNLTGLVLVTCALFYVFFRLMHMTSFYSCIFALLIFSAIMLFHRKDILFSSLLNGGLMVLVALPIYFIEILLSPGIVDATYIYQTLSGVRFLGIPIEELAFYYVFGFMVPIMYEYWKGFRLRSMPVKKSISQPKKAYAYNRVSRNRK